MNRKSNREKQITDFFNRYVPIQNHLDSSAGFDGAWFETFGIQEQFIFDAEAQRIWTIIDMDGELKILAGRHFVNRVGYLITTSEWRDPVEEYLFE